METIKNKEPRRLFIEQDNICERIISDKTRLEYIYKYTDESSRSKFIRYALKHNRSREDAEDIFEDSVIIIHIRIEEGKVILRCGLLSGWTPFLAYFWNIMRNLLMNRTEEPEVPENEINRINDRLSSLIDQDDAFDEMIKIIKFIYYEKLTDHDKKFFGIYFIEEYTHDKVVELNIGINNYDSSKSTKERLLVKLSTLLKQILKDDNLLDYIRWKY